MSCGAVKAESIFLNLSDDSRKVALVGLGMEQTQILLDRFRKANVDTSSDDDDDGGLTDRRCRVRAESRRHARRSATSNYYAQGFKLPASETRVSLELADGLVFHRHCDVWNYGVLCLQMLDTLSPSSSRLGFLIHQNQVTDDC